MLTRFKRNIVIAPDGTLIAYQSTGVGYPLVFCNGVGCDTYIWRYILEGLAQDYRLITWDYRGHGRSGTPTDPEAVTVDHVVEDLRLVLDDEGIDRCVLLGHSMGCQVLYEFAGRHPDRVGGVVGICGAFEHIASNFGNSTFLADNIETIYELLAQIPFVIRPLWRTVLPTYLGFLIGAFSKSLNPELVNPEDFRSYFEHMGQVDPYLFFRMGKSLQAHSAREMLPRITAPSLVIAGEFDTFTPPSASREAAELLPNSEFHMIRRASHAGPVEQPDLFVLLIENFLNRRVLKRDTREVPSQTAGKTPMITGSDAPGTTP